MKLGLFYVYDKENEVAISPLIPVRSFLDAAIGFSECYIKEKDIKKNPYNYKKLQLVQFAQVDSNDKGMRILNSDIVEKTGEEVYNFVLQEMKDRNIDDYFVDEVVTPEV